VHIKTISKTRPSNVTPFVLEGCWALDGLDQATLRSLSKEAKRKHVGVAEVIYEAVESFVAKCEAEAELETKIIKFPTSLKGSRRQSKQSSGGPDDRYRVTMVIKVRSASRSLGSVGDCGDSRNPGRV
jgi:hypothetical protein